MPSDNAWHPAPPPGKAIALSFVQVDFNPFENHAPLNYIVRLEFNRQTQAERSLIDTDIPASPRRLATGRSSGSEACDLPAGLDYGSKVRVRAGVAFSRPWTPFQTALVMIASGPTSVDSVLSWATP